MASIVFSLTSLSIGIYEAIVADNNMNGAGKCWQLYPNLVYCCVFNFLIFISFTNVDLTTNENFYEKMKAFFVSFSITTIIKNIWTLIIFCNIPETCVQKYENHNPNLLNTLNLEVILTFICFGILGLIIVMTFINCFILYLKDDENEEYKNIKKNNNEIKNDDKI